jgi:hypothetical protein
VPDVITWIEFMTILPPAWYLVWRFWIWGVDRVINQTYSMVGIICSIGLFGQAIWLMKSAYLVALGLVLVPCIVVPWFEGWREKCLERYFDEMEIIRLTEATLANPTAVHERVALARAFHRRKLLQAAIDHLTLAIKHAGAGTHYDSMLRSWKCEQAYFLRLANESPRVRAQLRQAEKARPAA